MIPFIKLTPKVAERIQGPQKYSLRISNLNIAGIGIWPTLGLGKIYTIKQK